MKLIKTFIAVLFLLGIYQNASAQDVSVLRGKVVAANPDVEKIHIININLEKGAITDKNGIFQISANENDSLYVSSVQFENKTVLVTREMINSGKIQIALHDKMNELAEVLIDDIKLSGYLASDLTKISVKEAETTNRLQNNLNTFIEKDKKLNPYKKPNPLGGITLFPKSFFNKESKDSPNSSLSSKVLVQESIQIVGREFFREDLKLNESEIHNFLYYCVKDAKFRQLVLNDNALVLIEYFQDTIVDFKTRRGAVLNTEKQIPG